MSKSVRLSPTTVYLADMAASTMGVVVLSRIQRSRRSSWRTIWRLDNPRVAGRAPLDRRRDGTRCRVPMVDAQGRMEPGGAGRGHMQRARFRTRSCAGDCGRPLPIRGGSRDDRRAWANSAVLRWPPCYLGRLNGREPPSLSDRHLIRAVQQHAILHVKFCVDQLLPNAFFYGQGSDWLGVKPLGLRMVGLERQQHRAGEKPRLTAAAPFGESMLREDDALITG